MPIHDWTRVPAGIFHNFHLLWIAELNNALNGGLLPRDYYALAEQSIGGATPDVLTLHQADAEQAEPRGDWESGSVAAVSVAPPKFAIAMQLDEAVYVAKQSRIVIHHVSDDRVVALIEVVSSGNKHSNFEFERFVRKAIEALDSGCHVAIIDLFPPTPRDPEGLHGAIWSELGDAAYTAPSGKPLTLAAYVADRPITAYVQPASVGDAMPDLPIFLLPTHYVNVPLERTYTQAFRHVPSRWRNVLDSAAN